MKFKVSNFKTIHPVPGMSAGAYFVGKADIEKIEVVDLGLVVHRGRGGTPTHPPALFTWANIIWCQIEQDEEPVATPKRKKTEE